MKHGVMAVVGIEIVREREAAIAIALQYPRCYSTARVLFKRWRLRGQESGGYAGNAGCGASPTAGKREGISF